MNIEQIKSFLYAVYYGSFNKAAEALFLTQPSITARIRTLEEELGRELFHREGNKLALTESGNIFLPYAEKLLGMCNEVEYKLQQQLSVSNELKIGCSKAISNYVIPEIMPELRRKHPEVQVNLISGNSKDIVDLVMKEEVDFGIIRTITNPILKIQPLFKSRVSLFAKPDHPLLEKGKPIQLSEMFAYDLIFYDHQSLDWLFFCRLLDQAKHSAKVIVEVDSTETAKRLIMKDLGICFLPEFAVCDEVNNGMLAKVPLAEEINIYDETALTYLPKFEESPFMQFFSTLSFENCHLHLD